MGLPLVLVVWFAISIPLAIVTGRGIARQAARTTDPPASERSALLDRLAEVELREIPRVQRALGGWVDDPYLAGELRELRAEAERLRASTSVVSTWPEDVSTWPEDVSTWPDDAEGAA